MKICTKCGINQSLTLFCFDKTTKDGRHPWCKKCRTKARMNWFRLHKEDHHKSYNQWYSRNRTKQREKIRKWHNNNKQWFFNYLKVWNLKNPNKKREYKAIRDAQKRVNGGNFTLQDWRNLKSTYEFTCLSCGKKEPEIILTIDHIIPLSLGGKHERINIQPLCKMCNSIKQARTIDFRKEVHDRSIRSNDYNPSYFSY